MLAETSPDLRHINPCVNNRPRYLYEAANDSASGNERGGIRLDRPLRIGRCEGEHGPRANSSEYRARQEIEIGAVFSPLNANELPTPDGPR